MKQLVPTLLLCITLAFSSSTPAQGNKGHRIAARMAKVLGFKTAGSSLPQQLLLATVLACTTFACGTVKPHLYTIGILNPSSAMRAEVIAEAVLTAQRDFDTQAEGTSIISRHVYAIKPGDYEIILAEVVRSQGKQITLQRYANKYELTISSNSIAGYLVDDHPKVGDVVKLPTDTVGYSHLLGSIFAVYSNGVYAIKITSKADFDGQQEELHGKDDAPHIRFAYESQPQ